MNLGMTELIVIFAIILVLFGGRRLPGLGKALGDTIREFKKGIGGEADQDQRVERQAQQVAPPSQGQQLGSANQNETVQTQKETDKTKS